jgi:hypothetical protein
MTRALALVIMLVGCGLGRQPNYYSIRPDGSRSEVYSRINEYASYETGGLGRQAAVAAAYEEAQHAPPPAKDVEIFNASLPPGVKATGGGIEIQPGTPLAGVGRFEIGYWLSSAPPETEVGDDLKRLAAVTNADVVVVEVQRVKHGDPRVNHLNGVLLRRVAQPTVVVSPVPPVVRPRVTAQLVYQANARGCLSAGEFADEVSARLGYSPWVDASANTLHTEIVEQGGTYRATIRVPSGASKEVAGASCRAVTDAAISAIVVRLDT